MKATDYIAKFLHERGVRSVFELSGGMITHLLDSIHRAGQVRLVSVHHEQGAAFAADAVGRMTGVPGVAMATSGPGATNLLTGMGSCHFDSSPAVFITGQVNRHEQKGERAVRQLGFQETDIVSMARPITKAAWQVREAEELPLLLKRAFQLATNGRPGPVLVDIPMDLQRANLSAAAMAAEPEPLPALPPIPNSIWPELFASLARAQRPVILVGGGIRAGWAAAELQTFAERLGVPVVHSLMGGDVLPFSHPLRVGLIGSYGNRWANLALGRSDFLIVLGSRLDVRQTGSEAQAFKTGREIFHVDCEAGEINNRVTGCHAILSSLKDFLAAALAETAGRRFSSRESWLQEIAALRTQWPDVNELAGVPGINPNRLMHELARVAHSAAAYVVDVGQHQMWAGQSLELALGQRFLTSGGMGSMGFALPAAVGAAVAAPGRPVVVVAGDGGFQCNLQELQTVARNRLPLKMLVLNNRCHGMVRQFQESYFSGRYVSTMWGYDAPDFARVAAAYGIASRAVREPGDVPGALDWLWTDPQSPALLEVAVDPTANAYPKIAFGHPITEMEPFAKPLEMEGT